MRSNDSYVLNMLLLCFEFRDHVDLLDVLMLSSLRIVLTCCSQRVQSQFWPDPSNGSLVLAGVSEG